MKIEDPRLRALFENATIPKSYVVPTPRPYPVLGNPTPRAEPVLIPFYAPFQTTLPPHYPLTPELVPAELPPLSRRNDALFSLLGRRQASARSASTIVPSNLADLVITHDQGRVTPSSSLASSTLPTPTSTASTSTSNSTYSTPLATVNINTKYTNIPTIGLGRPTQSIPTPTLQTVSNPTPNITHEMSAPRAVSCDASRGKNKPSEMEAVVKVRRQPIGPPGEMRLLLERNFKRSDTHPRQQAGSKLKILQRRG